MDEQARSSKATQLPLPQNKRKSVIRDPYYAEFTYTTELCPPGALELVRAPPSSRGDIAVGTPVGKATPRLGNSAREKWIADGARFYRAHLNPLRHCPEDRRRQRDNRFYRTEYALISQSNNHSIHAYAVQHEWAQSAKDKYQDNDPEKHQLAYRDHIRRRVETELNATAKACNRYVDEGNRFKVLLGRWQKDTKSVNHELRDYILLVALTTPTFLRHVSDPNDVDSEAKIIAKAMGIPQDEIDKIGKKQPHKVQPATLQPQNLSGERLSDARQQPLHLTIDIKTKGGLGIVPEVVTVSENNGPPRTVPLAPRRGARLIRR